MSQTLTYTIGSDRRALVDNIQDFKVDFGDDNHNWVQARQFERGMRQVFVNIVNEDNTPFDLTGCNVWFEGLLPNTANGDFRVIDSDGYVPLDPSAGKFRFDMPGHAFTIAGSYRQAFFRIVKNGNSVTTLEFDLDVLADKVIDGLVPKDWIGPFEQIADQLVDDLQKHTDAADKIIADFQQKVTDLVNQLNQQGSTTTSMLTELQNRITDLETKIKQDGLFTQAEADTFKQEVQNELTKFGDAGSYSEPGSNLIEKIINEADDRGINVRHFGATGDGVTDDTEAFQNAIDYAGKHNRSAVYVPAGKYVITKELTLNFIALFGEGVVSSVLIPKGPISRLITLQWKAIVHNLRIDNSQVTGAISDLCLAPESGEVGTNNIVRDVTFDDDGTHEVTAIDASPKTSAAGQTIFSFPNVIDSITMSNIYNGIHLYSSQGGWINGNVFQNITIQGFRNTGLWLDGGEDRVSISHNSFENIQVQYQKYTPNTARAFKINYGVNNKFSMIHTWQDQGTGAAIPSMELNPLSGADSWDIRNNTFDGIFESEIDGDPETLNYNDMSGIRLSYWISSSFKNGYGSLNTTKTLAENLLPQNLVADYVQGKRSPLQWDGTYYKPTDKGIDDKGYYVQFTKTGNNDPNGKSTFGLALNGSLDGLRHIQKYTVCIDFDLNGEDDSNTDFNISSGYFDNTNRTALPKGHHQMVKLQNGVYRYYETFSNNVESSDPMFLYAYFGGCNTINFRHYALIPQWIGPYQDIRESHNTSMWSINSATKIDFSNSSSSDIQNKLQLHLLNLNTNDWFDKNLIQETNRSNGSFVYTYPIYI
ncbi:BppU family phage baseplate upper protein [Limosilactobacillus fermentum]|uniref:BppU family phage baseplate upper protein n=1 Tax=Limosilactobacillus fermentum TaxID=1613 RepID=UPI00285C82CE|nr:BppU family phage baseplate upper protein [Limosilactobacillus fermentum]MDR7663608.1 BppU family phage baseplate upper protein [Limosilactobacillus fermentum]MDR7663658.1 BppU family phage baseplate upper protein [Limosilactobacillus fermentum]